MWSDPDSFVSGVVAGAAVVAFLWGALTGMWALVAVGAVLALYTLWAETR